MYQTDQSIEPAAQSDLGIEARSILKSIQTEHSKLKQSSSIAQSDLHYFRARFNYYRLSLTRLLPKERESLEPHLSSFYEEIAALESGQATGLEVERPTPFLEPVEPKPEPEVRVTEEVASPASVSKEAIDQLKLLRLALEAEPSKSGNQLIAHQLDTVIQRLST